LSDVSLAVNRGAEVGFIIKVRIMLSSVGSSEPGRLQPPL
jgi:hypothetical protein